MEGPGAVLEQKSHCLVHILASNKLEVIQHQGNLPAGRIQVIDQAGQDCFRGCLACRRQELRGLTPDRIVSLLLWWIQDDIAKIATLLHNGGKLNDEQLLHPDLLLAAVQQDPNDRGVDIDRRRKYNNAFWAQCYDQADGFDCEFWVPQMLGVSGNVVALMPNGSTYYYFGDNQQFTWDAAIRESDKIAPHCP
jgi:hypothetical protein